MSGLAVEARGLAKVFRVGFLARRVVAVRKVDLQIPEGAVFGVVGPNGAGKSTTLKMLLGLVKPDSGSGTMLGHPLGSLQARRNVGFLPELPSFPGHLEAAELLDFHARLAGCFDSAWSGRRQALLERVGLGKVKGVRLKGFSKGMLQRAGVAVALVGDPRLLVLDEPMSGLDPLGRHDMRRLLRELKDAGKTVLFSTHVLADVEALCDSLAIISQGVVFRQGPLHSLLAESAAGVEVRLMNLPAGAESQLTPLGTVSSVGPMHLWELNRPELVNDALTVALKLGARVIQVAPRTGALEDLVVRAARDADATDRVSPT